jgi:hypothetical protein
MDIKYRYRCRTCAAKGRWLVNPNDAVAAAGKHMDKFEAGHWCDLIDTSGKNHGTAT